MPFPTPLRVPPVARPRRRSPGAVGCLVLAAFALAGTAAVVGRTAGLALLVGATAVLGVAAAVAMRAHWAAAAPAEPQPTVAPTPVAADGDRVAGELRRLRAAHIEKVDLALDEGREDLARELADAYTDQALALLTRG